MGKRYRHLNWSVPVLLVHGAVGNGMVILGPRCREVGKWTSDQAFPPFEILVQIQRLPGGTQTQSMLLLDFLSKGITCTPHRSPLRHTFTICQQEFHQKLVILNYIWLSDPHLWIYPNQTVELQHDISLLPWNYNFVLVTKPRKQYKHHLTHTLWNKLCAKLRV